MSCEKHDQLVAVITNHDDDVYCFRRELIKELVGEGYRVLVSCPYGERLELIKDIGYEYVDTQVDRRGTSVINDLRLFLSYLRMLRRYRPSIVLTYTMKPNIYGGAAAALLGIPYISNVTGFGSISSKQGFVNRLVMFLLARAFSKSSCVFFQNAENLAIALRQGMIKGPYQLLPGSGVNTEHFSLLPFPDEDETIVFNYIGRVLRDKGIDDYISAAKRIRSRYPNTQFNVVGFIEPTEMHYAEELSSLQKEGIVVYHGRQMDVRPFIARSHCTIHPSRYGEGMSNVILESASSGRPVITTDIAGCREAVDDGVSGFIYQAGNVDDLVAKIELFLRMSKDARSRMGIAGRNKVCSAFSRDQVVRAYLHRIRLAL